MEFQDKFVAFVDLLGFKHLVEGAERGEGMSLDDIVTALGHFDPRDQRAQFQKYGPLICPNAERKCPDLGFRLTQVSDCAVISAEVSPAGVVNLIAHCSDVVLRFLQLGVLCRGYITRGSIYHTETHFIGSGYHAALDGEKRVHAFGLAGKKFSTPFVELEPDVYDYAQSCGDSCVAEMTGRRVESDGQNVVIYPFRRLAHAIVCDHSLHAERERESSMNMRRLLTRTRERVLKLRDNGNEDAVAKCDHYLRALDEQLAVCDENDRLINSVEDQLRR